MQAEEKLFICLMCDDCCHGGSTICLTPEDVRNMSLGLNLSEAELLGKYCLCKPDYLQMKVVDNHCIFWAGKCSIHLFKPGCCREWPFVPSLMEKTSFLTIQRNCPGFNKEITYDEALPLIKEVVGLEHDRSK